MFRKNNNSVKKSKTYNGKFPMSRDKEKKRMIMDINSSIDTKANEMNKGINYYTDCLKEILNEKKSLYIFFK